MPLYDYLDDSNGVLSSDLSSQIVKLESNPFAQGGQADVWKATWKKQEIGDVLVAVKVPRGLWADTEQVDECRRRLLREVRTWRTLNHPNIAPLFGISFDFYQQSWPCLVSPFYRRGDASQYLKKNPHTNRFSMITQVAGAISYLHNRPSPILHGDIKACNILMGDNNEAVLAAGLSRILSASGFTTASAVKFSNDVGTEMAETDVWASIQIVTAEAWRWKAPEQITSSSGKYGCIPITAATDVWSFAMTVVEIFTGHIPFSHIRNDGSVVLAIASGMKPKRERHMGISDCVWAMLERCWDWDPNQRPSMVALAEFFGFQSTLPSTSPV